MLLSPHRESQQAAKETFRPTSNWRVIATLLAYAIKRSRGRAKRQQQLFNRKAKPGSLNFGLGLTVLTYLGFCFIQLMVGFVIYLSIGDTNAVEIELDGKFAVSSYLLSDLGPKVQKYGAAKTESEKADALSSIKKALTSEAKSRTHYLGNTEKYHQDLLFNSLIKNGFNDFQSDKESRNKSLAWQLGHSKLAALIAIIALLWWFVAMTFQSEGLELDFQRQRHPMWEWLLSHPVEPGIIFFTDLITPLFANPILATSPVFWGAIFTQVHDLNYGIAAAILIGVPIALAASFLGKSIEIWGVLRLSPRSRGAVLGILGWIGYSSFFLMFFIGLYAAQIFYKILRIRPTLLSSIDLSLVPQFFGVTETGQSSLLKATIMAFAFSLLAISASLLILISATKNGIAGASGKGAPAVIIGKVKSKFRRRALFRKETLWFLRDRAAVVQCILIPMTLAGYQAFNMRGITSNMAFEWNTICGFAAIFGTYILFILGPRSLTSEGGALWIALTWPKGLEDLLKNKAKLWMLLTSGLVGIILLFAIYEFPQDYWKILLVAIGWVIFAKSMAEKSVTLVTAPSSSGEVGTVPTSRRMAAGFGMFAFASGLITGQWSIAVAGVVFSQLTAVAMWENFRERIPFLFDQWSEKLPPAPTLMHAMIAISAMLEISAIFFALASINGGAANPTTTMATCYAMAAVIVVFITLMILSQRDVFFNDILTWPHTNKNEASAADAISIGQISIAPRIAYCGLAICLAICLSFGANYYTQLLEPMIEGPVAQGLSRPGIGIFLLFGLLAPLAEEFLFRGLLYRALDRQWGGWKAVLGSALFFASYHQPIAWLPVGLLGVFNAVLFKKSGSLFPSIMLHMVYNFLVVILAS